MMRNFDTMTTVELKQYLSEHRNNEDAFRAGLQILMDRRDPSARQPYPFDLSDPEREVETLLKENFNRNN